MVRLRPTSRRRNFRKSLSSRPPWKHRSADQGWGGPQGPRTRGHRPHLVSEGLVLPAGPSQVNGGKPTDGEGSKVKGQSQVLGPESEPGARTDLTPGRRSPGGRRCPPRSSSPPRSWDLPPATHRGGGVRAGDAAQGAEPGERAGQVPSQPAPCRPAPASYTEDTTGSRRAPGRLYRGR